MSTSPDCSAVKRCCAVNGTYLTLSGSPYTAAEIARQMSILKPLYFPWLSGWPNPGVPACTPQVREPACFTLSSVGPAWADAVNPSAAAKPAAIAACIHLPGIPCPPCACRAGRAEPIRLIGGIAVGDLIGEVLGDGASIRQSRVLQLRSFRVRRSDDDEHPRPLPPGDVEDRRQGSETEIGAQGDRIAAERAV